MGDLVNYTMYLELRRFGELHVYLNVVERFGELYLNISGRIGELYQKIVRRFDNLYLNTVMSIRYGPTCYGVTYLPIGALKGQIFEQ